MILMTKTSISNNRLSRLKKIRSQDFKTDSILRQIIEDVITDVYEIPFKEFGKTGERIAFKLLHHIAELDNTAIHNREMKTRTQKQFKKLINISHHFSYECNMLKEATLFQI